MEHSVFGMFYNWPLTIRRRMGLRAEARRQLKPRRWHAAACAIGGVAVLALCDWLQIHSAVSETLQEIWWPKLGMGQEPWWAAVGVALAAGSLATMGAGGLGLGRRILLGALSGVAVAVLSAVVHAVMGQGEGLAVSAGGFGKLLFWRVFILTIVATLAAVITELKLPAPRDKRTD